MNAPFNKLKKTFFILFLAVISFITGIAFKTIRIEQEERSAWEKVNTIDKNTIKGDFNVLSHDKDSFGMVEIRQGGFQLINPLLDCYQISSPGLREMKILKEKLNGYIINAKAENKAEDISVYYRDLSNGPWLGIDQDELFSPASLIKVPILIAALKYAEYVPEYLSKKITYEGVKTDPQNIITGDMIVPGNTYTILELLKHMIIYSDNQAAEIVYGTLDPRNVDKIYYDLGIDIKSNSKSDPDKFISCREYAGFFRVLYNASYLNKDMSELALQILVQSNYMNGLAAGLPAGTQIADKFGERTFIQRNIKQLHDCGIVYLDKKPYILCVMTRGRNYRDLEEVISSISKIVYLNITTGT